MVELFLSEPIRSGGGDDESVKKQISLLNKLESMIWSLLMSCGARSEARLWLCNSLSKIRFVTPRHQRELFVKILRSKPLKRALAAQVLQMMFEKYPRKTGYILAKRSHLLENFFKGNSKRILQWFSHFSSSGDLGHRRGAKALSQFAFVNRDICWDELEWKGKHGQSPAMVATKPHYFLDLDVQQTVENFLENVPEFWSSDEFSASLEDGEILFIDTRFFVDFFVDLMFKEDSKEAWEVVNEFLMEESFSSLCHHLLIILEERDFCVFLESLHKILNARIESVDFGNPSYWLEIILSKCGDSVPINQLFLINAVISQGRQLLRLVREEEDGAEKVKIKDIVVQICMCSYHPSSLASITKQCFKEKTIDTVKWLGLQSWTLHYILSEECRTRESWELLFIDNGISFRKSDNYEVLRHDGFLEGLESDLEERTSVGVRRKKKEKHRKKRRKNLDDDESYDNELLDLDMPKNRLSLQSRGDSWLLSTDAYSTLWSSVDLPEHLSRHCFSAWMKWFFARCRDEA
ncbi:uncharacterized protein LOC130795502 [Actinidia eriantha]|uniref:uncharacterized protein LOC130795502 n=1 Tax=Actinidia eriantha TaxID=165200 RepID=UPI0025871900|nr:uncharacterized protein LOC130795502 [Actinidia eriantha]